MVLQEGTAFGLGWSPRLRGLPYDDLFRDIQQERIGEERAEWRPKAIWEHL